MMLGTMLRRIIVAVGMTTIGVSGCTIDWEIAQREVCAMHREYVFKSGNFYVTSFVAVNDEEFVVTGEFNGIMQFGREDEPDEQFINASDSSKVFVAKTRGAAWAWANEIYGAASLARILTGPHGELALIFKAQGIVTYDGKPVGDEGSIVVVHLDEHGNYLRHDDLTGYHGYSDAAFDSNGYLFVALQSYDPILLKLRAADGAIDQQYELAQAMQSWIRYGVHLAPGVHGEMFFAGTIDGTMNCGPITVSSTQGEDAFLAKIDESGVPQLLQQYKGAGNQKIYSVVTNVDGNVIVGGSVSGGPEGPMDFGGGLISRNWDCYWSPFIAAFDSSGHYLDGHMFGRMDAGDWESWSLVPTGHADLISNNRYYQDGCLPPTHSHPGIQKLDLGGKVLWQVSFSEHANARIIGGSDESVFLIASTGGTFGVPLEIGCGLVTADEGDTILQIAKLSP